MHEDHHRKLVFKVIVSDDEQYSLWLLDREEPPGWRDTGNMRGSAIECLTFIKEWYFRERQGDAEPVSSTVNHAKPANRAAYA